MQQLMREEERRIKEAEDRDKKNGPITEPFIGTLCISYNLGIQTVEIPCDRIGRLMAGVGDRDQAVMLNSFFEDLKVRCETYDREDFQLCSIAPYLSAKARESMARLLNFANFKE